MPWDRKPDCVLSDAAEASRPSACGTVETKMAPVELQRHSLPRLQCVHGVCVLQVSRLEKVFTPKIKLEFPPIRSTDCQSTVCHEEAGDLVVPCRADMRCCKAVAGGREQMREWKW